MRIEHVAMYVEDLEKTKEFFIKYFDAAAGEQYYNPKTEFQSYFLSFEDGARLGIFISLFQLEAERKSMH